MDCNFKRRKKDGAISIKKPPNKMEKILSAKNVCMLTTSNTTCINWCDFPPVKFK